MSILKKIEDLVGGGGNTPQPRRQQLPIQNLQNLLDGAGHLVGGAAQQLLQPQVPTPFGGGGGGSWDRPRDGAGFPGPTVPKIPPHLFDYYRQQMGYRGMVNANGDEQWNPLMGGAPMTQPRHAPIPSFMGDQYAQNPTDPQFLNVDPAQFGYPPDNTALPIYLKRR